MDGEVAHDEGENLGAEIEKQKRIERVKGQLAELEERYQGEPEILDQMEGLRALLFILMKPEDVIPAFEHAASQEENEELREMQGGVLAADNIMLEAFFVTEDEFDGLTEKFNLLRANLPNLKKKYDLE